jgi:hypothetical protein
LLCKQTIRVIEHAVNLDMIVTSKGSGKSKLELSDFFPKIYDFKNRKFSKYKGGFFLLKNVLESTWGRIWPMFDRGDII